MNALCALHHFCDLHGPQTLLCTEGRTYIQDYSDNDNEELKTYYSQFMNAKNPQEKTQCQVIINIFKFLFIMNKLLSSS